MNKKYCSTTIRSLKDYEDFFNESKKYNKMIKKINNNISKENDILLKYIDKIIGYNGINLCIERDCKIKKFSKLIKSIEFRYGYNEYLPSFKNTNIQSLHFYDIYNRELPSLKNTKIKKIIFSTHYNHALPSLQNTLIKHIEFGHYYNKPLPDLENTNIKYIKFGGTYNQKLPDLKNVKIKTLSMRNVREFIKLVNPVYLMKLSIVITYINIKKYKNQIFKIVYKNCCIDRPYSHFIIRKNLIPFIKYILYNSHFIPYEIYNYIYMNYNYIYILTENNIHKHPIL